MSATPRVMRMQVVLDTTQPLRDAEFWRQLLELEYYPGHEPDAEHPEDVDWIGIRSSDGTRRLAFQKVDSLQQSTWPDPGVPQQLHLDLAVASVDDLNAMARQATALGGSERYDRRADPEEPLVVLTDPSGHPFCVFVGPS